MTAGEAPRARDSGGDAPTGDAPRVHAPSDAPTTREDVVVEGARLSYLAAGPDGGDVVLLLHGMPASAELWRDVIPRFAVEGYRVLAPDLPGYGATRLPARSDRSLAGAATLLATWLIAREEQAWVIGHDLGGAVAQILVTAHPEVVSRLTLCDSVFADVWPVTPIRLLRAVARIRAFELMVRLKLGRNPYTSWQVRRGFADPGRIDAATIERVFWDGKLDDAAGRREFARHLELLDNQQTVAIVGDLRGVDVPVHLIWATEDAFLPWSPVGERLRDSFGTAPTVTLIDDAGHFLPLERPDAFADAALAT